LLLETGRRGTGMVREPTGKGTSAVGNRYQATASEDVTVDTSVCVTMNCEVSRSPKNVIINSKPVCSHPRIMKILTFSTERCAVKFALYPWVKVALGTHWIRGYVNPKACPDAVK
jgi:hypothetical protein